MCTIYKYLLTVIAVVVVAVRVIRVVLFRQNLRRPAKLLLFRVITFATAVGSVGELVGTRFVRVTVKLH